MKIIRARVTRRLKPLANDPMRWIVAHEQAFKRRGARDLRDVMQIFSLSSTDTGRLLGVTRQAVDQFVQKGVPVNRLADVGQIAQAARMLDGLFRSERIPQIVREPVPGLDGRTVLDIAQTEPQRIIELIEATRSYIPPA